MGVFEVDDGAGNYEQRIKIINDESIGNYSWDSSASTVNQGYGINQWGESDSYNGADLMRTLNGIYYNRESGTCYTGEANATSSCNFTSIGLNSTAKNMIGDAKWYTGGIPYVYGLELTTQNAYDYERSDLVPIMGAEDPNGYNDTVTRTNNWVGKVALPYLSDILYSSAPYRDSSVNDVIGDSYNNEEFTNSNWMAKEMDFWLLTPFQNSSVLPFQIQCYNGIINIADEWDSYGAYMNLAARPAVYLKSNVKITSGTGTSSDPYELSL